MMIDDNILGTSSTIVYHLVRGYKERVLVCAPSNIATDNLTIMIHKMGLHVVRVVARSRESVSSLVDQFCIHSLAPKVFGENSELARLHAQKIVCVFYHHCSHFH